jgi:hypothetical protein
MDGDTAISARVIGCAIEVHERLGDRVVVEIKSVQRLAPIHVAQMLTYLRVMSLRVGLILNFNTEAMKNGIRRVVLDAQTHGSGKTSAFPRLRGS